MAKALGTDDSITTCDCCGRSNLKFTVAMELDDGEIVHYGQVCAGRNTGKTRPQINAEINAEAKRIRSAAAAEYKATAAAQALEAALKRRPRELVGRAALDFILAEDEAATAARFAVAAKWGIKPCEVAVC